MKLLDLLAAEQVLVEFGQSSVKILNQDAGLDIPIERLENGRLSPASRDRVIQSLQTFLREQTLLRRQPAICAIGARGVSLRRLKVPASSPEELQRLLLLQIESEFPLPPDELAWGCVAVGDARPANGAARIQDLIVVAVKRETVEEYSEILSACGLSPTFTLGALARSSICPHPPEAYAILDIGRRHSELISFDQGALSSIRILPWGGEALTRSIEKGLQIDHDEAERIKISLAETPGPKSELAAKVWPGIEAEIEALADLVRKNPLGQKLYVSGKSSQLKEFAPSLARALPAGVACEPIEIMNGDGRSAATVGLQRFLESDGGRPPLTLDLQSAKKEGEVIARPLPGRWVALACLLALGALSLRYAEAVLWKPRLARKLAETRAYRESLPSIDRQLSFLKYIETNRAPYLDTLVILANAASPGTRFDTLSLNRRGELSFRATMQVSQPADFRSKLIDSGFFSTVVVEEQTPSQDRQRVVVRMTAQLKPTAARPSIPTPASSPTGLRGEKPPGEARPSPVIRRGAPPPGPESKP